MPWGLLFSAVLFSLCRAFAGRGTHKRGQRRSVEVASRPGFEAQLRAGDQLCSVKAGQTRAVGDGEGGRMFAFLRYWSWTLEERWDE